MFPFTPAQAGEIVRIYIGAGPTLNLNLHPKMTFLKDQDQSDLGIYYEIRDQVGKSAYALQVASASMLPKALAAMLYQRFIELIEEKNGHLAALTFEDSSLISAQLLAQAGSNPSSINNLNECTSLMTYLRDQSSTVYAAEDLAAVQPFLCE